MLVWHKGETDFIYSIRNLHFALMNNYAPVLINSPHFLLQSIAHNYICSLVINEACFHTCGPLNLSDAADNCCISNAFLAAAHTQCFFMLKILPAESV